VKVRSKAPSKPEQAPKPAQSSFKRRILNRENHDPAQQLPVAELVIRIVALAQALKERQFYPYQVELATRIVESLLEHDSETITALMSRQAGKTESLGAIVAAIAIILPILARQFPDDWHLNTTDDNGVYRGFADGVKIGIYAPRLDQSEIMFERVKQALETNTAKQILREMNIALDTFNGNTVKMSHGSHILCESASEQSKIEGATHNLLVVEEAQDISDLKVKKSLHPMVSSTAGTIVKVGTATTHKCDFYTSIKQNERTQLETGKRNHFFYPYTVAVQYNSMYKAYVEKEKQKLGEDSDEFRTSYCGEWIFERGMFVTDAQLFHKEVAMTGGVFSIIHRHGIAKEFEAFQHYSIVVGLDWGAANDSTVLTPLAVDWDNPEESGEGFSINGIFRYNLYRKHVLNWVEYRGDNYVIQMGEVVPYLRSIRNLRKIVMDSNGCGLPLFHQMSAIMADSDIEVADFNFQSKLKSDGFKSLYADICSRRITFPASEQVRRIIQYRRFIGQMRDLRKNYKKQLMQVAAPEEKDAHDDYPVSMMLAAWGANEPAVSSTVDLSDSNFLMA
jgi:hypothetical protein